MHHMQALHFPSLLVLPISGAKEPKRHSFKTFATFFHRSSLFLFRQQESLSDPKSSPENYLQIGVGNFSLEHCIISIQPYGPTHGRHSRNYLTSYRWSKTP
jgi:hypothetical protein